MRVPVFASPSAGSADLGLVSDRKGVFGGEEEGGGVRSRPGAARTILLSHIISARPSKQPLMVRTFLKVYMELGFYYAGAWSRSMPFLRTVAAAAGGAAQRGRDKPLKNRPAYALQLCTVWHTRPVACAFAAGPASWS